MKEGYFTPENLPGKAREMLASLVPHRRKQPPRFLPCDAALLVLDMQAYFLDPASHAFVPSSAAILPGVRALVEAFGACHRPVISTRHLNTLKDAGQMSSWWRDLLTGDHPYSQVSPTLDFTGAIILYKPQYDAFYATNLEDELRSRSITQVVICGVMTHLCCETTARSAFMRGFQVFFCVDGTATYTEAHHRAALLNLAHGFATLVTVTDILEALK